MTACAEMGRNKQRPYEAREFEDFIFEVRFRAACTAALPGLKSGASTRMRRLNLPG